MWILTIVCIIVNQSEGAYRWKWNQGQTTEKSFNPHRRVNPSSGGSQTAGRGLWTGHNRYRSGSDRDSASGRSTSQRRRVDSQPPTAKLRDIGSPSSTEFPVASDSEWSEWSEFSPSPRSKEEEDLNLEFVFPDQLSRLTKRIPEKANRALGNFIPTGCPNFEDYCEHVQDYPDTAVLQNQLAQTTSLLEAELMFTPVDQAEKLRLQSRFSSRSDVSDVTSRLPKGDQHVVAMQEGLKKISSQSFPGRQEVDFVREEAVCDSQESFVYPRTARNRNKQWRFVINVPGEGADPNYVQAVKVEKCLREGTSCNLATTGFETTVCRQKYTYRRLMALGENGDQYVESFRFPSCCVCFRQSSFTYDDGYDFELLRDGDNKTSRNAVGGNNSPVTRRQKSREKLPKLTELLNKKVSRLISSSTISPSVKRKKFKKSKPFKQSSEILSDPKKDQPSFISLFPSSETTPPVWKSQWSNGRSFSTRFLRDN